MRNTRSQTTRPSVPGLEDTPRPEARQSDCTIENEQQRELSSKHQSLYSDDQNDNNQGVRATPDGRNDLSPPRNVPHRTGAPMPPPDPYRGMREQTLVSESGYGLTPSWVKKNLTKFAGERDYVRAYNWTLEAS